MSTRFSSFMIVALLAAAAGCGGSSSPTGPSAAGGAGATIAGTVTRTGSAAMTVGVAGTNLSAAVDPGGAFQVTDVPSGTVQLQFRDGTTSATAQIANVASNQWIEIQVQVSGTTATVITEVRTGKLELCHATGNGSYHSIEVSESAEPAHRAHGDAKVGEPVPGRPTMTFDSNCVPSGPSVEITKSTNGQDANEAPGPSIEVGAAVNWTYAVRNTGTVALTNVQVVDDRGVAVSCPSTSLSAGASMTCTGSGVATLGQYRNVGTVTASWASGTVTDNDPSHYLGVAPTTEEGQKVQLCHRTGNGSYHLIDVSVSAEPAHRAHGDAKVGEAVPGQAGRTFAPDCSVR